MMDLRKLPLAIAFGIALLATHPCLEAQTREDEIVSQSITVLDSIMSTPAQAIPESMLRDAYAVAIIPNVLKGSFVIGARHGKGTLVIRDNQAGWHAPIFINLTGGNIGWQVGVQRTDVVLVFKTERSVQGLLNGKFTLGADAAIAAGPVGGQAAAATHGNFSAEIYSWSRSRGLFIGVSLDGSVIDVDQLENAAFYRRDPATNAVIIPQVAQTLVARIAQYTGVREGGVAPTQNASATQTTPQTILAQQHSIEETTHVRDELARFARQLYQKIDPAWQSYLALPAEVFNGNGHADPQALNVAISHFEAIEKDPRYASLTNDAEFQSTLGLLKHYAQDLANQSQALQLPPPPAFSR